MSTRLLKRSALYCEACDRLRGPRQPMGRYHMVPDRTQAHREAARTGIPAPWSAGEALKLGDTVNLPRGMVVWNGEGDEPRWYVKRRGGSWAWRCPKRHNPKWTVGKLAARLAAGYDTV